MKSLLDKYFNYNIPIQERLFYIASFMSSVSSLGFVSIALFLQADAYTIVIYNLIFLTGLIFFLLEKYTHKTNVLSVAYLTLVNLVYLPLVMYFSENITVDVPLYMLIGLTYSLVLLTGKTRVIHFSLQLIVDLVFSFYCYVLRNRDARIVYGAVSPSQFISLEISIIISGILCGTIIAYRNSQLTREMLDREEATAQAEKVSYAKDMFLVNVSHEIRTPLNAIIGTTDLLLDSNASNHVKEMAYNISNSSHALLSITTDLLDFSRLNVDSVSLENGNFDFALMLNDIINLMSVRLLDSSVEFFVKINPDLPKILYGDSGKIRQIIINMLSNAIKYTKAGYMMLLVDFKWESEERIRIFIDVEDTGIGIKEESLEKIFVPFNRSGEITDRQIEGNGLGLSLCRKMCEAMGGRIYAESEYGKGSVFHFEVPMVIKDRSNDTVGFARKDKEIALFLDNRNDGKTLNDICNGMGLKFTWADCDEEFIDFCDKNTFDFMIIDASAYDRIKKSLSETNIDWRKIVVVANCNSSYSNEPFENVLTKPVSCLNMADVINNKKNFAVRKQTFNGKLSLKNVSIMVVDDNLINLSVAAGLFERYEPKTVITAASGKEALNAIVQEHVDIVFLDYMMPDMDGIDTLKAIRALDGEKYKKVPIVALTANVVSGAREMFLDAGFDDYLAKPIEIDQFEKTLVEHVPEGLIRYKV